MNLRERPGQTAPAREPMQGEAEVSGGGVEEEGEDLVFTLPTLKLGG